MGEAARLAITGRSITHTLSFLEPGHFHAALTLGARHARVSDEIFVYARPGAELDDFLALVEAFNRRPEQPTAWRPILRTGDRPLDELIAERPGELVILAGRNDRKMTAMRRLHDAGFHQLADKPWMAEASGLDDLRHIMAGGPLAVEMMTGRHDITSILTGKLVRERGVFGDFDVDSGKPSIEISGVHHLEKMVNGRPLRRPAWYFDVRVQGNGLADIPTHMVDQVQRLAAAASRSESGPPPPLELLAARTWPTLVPRGLFARVTGQSVFPPELSDMMKGDELAYRANAELAFRLGAVTAALDTRWDLSTPPGGGDTHRSVIRGTRAEILVEQHEGTGFRRRLSVVPLGDGDGVRAALANAVAAWQTAHPGLDVLAAGATCEIRVPRSLEVGHEAHFPLMLADFLALVEGGRMPSDLASATLAKYTLLAQAAVAARRPS
ncbi:MAG TPA: putative oxidoreductase C-terminal domain-containing protein [Methylomirabilota bacterium]|nr:putative oxidoreductase C-terminal domain-containing protein [Methylomirabilota bacterium]